MQEGRQKNSRGNLLGMEGEIKGDRKAILTG